MYPDTSTGDATTSDAPQTISGVELMSNGGLWSGTFYQRFQSCMNSMYMPAPDSLFSGFMKAVEVIKALKTAMEAGDATIGELVAAGTLGGEFGELAAQAGAVLVSAYVGVCIGCLASAGIDYSGLF
jgi:hypothetical protein